MAVPRFTEKRGTISVESGASTVFGTGTFFAGRNREAAYILAYPEGVPPVPVGFVAVLEPGLVYQNLQLPLDSPYTGDDLEDVAFVLVDGPAIANGATQAAIYARFAAMVEQSMGLVGNRADAIDYSLVPENTLFVDDATRALYQWRGGILQPVLSVALPWLPRGAWAGSDPELHTYAENDFVIHLGAAFISNEDDNFNNAPPFVDGEPSSNSHWTYLPLPTGPVLSEAQFLFDTGTANTDPGAGKIRLSAAAPNAATVIRVDNLDRFGVDVTGILARLAQGNSAIKGALRLANNDISEWIDYDLTAAAAQSGYYNLTGAFKESSAALPATNPFTAADVIHLIYRRHGDHGGGNYTFGVSLIGDALPAGGQTLLRHKFETDVLFPAGWPLCSLSSKTAAPEDAVFSVKKFTDINDAAGTVVANLTILEGEKEAAAPGAAERLFAAGTYLEFCAPDPPVAGLLDVTATLAGLRVQP